MYGHERCHYKMLQRPQLCQLTDPPSVDKVLCLPHYELDSKMTDPKLAFPHRVQSKMMTTTKKVFLGRLTVNTVVEDVKQYFEQFGKVEDAMLVFDKSTNRRRGFGFITLENEYVVEKVCEIHFCKIHNKMVEHKKSPPKEAMLFPPGTRVWAGNCLTPWMCCYSSQA